MLLAASERLFTESATMETEPAMKPTVPLPRASRMLRTMPMSEAVFPACVLSSGVGFSGMDAAICEAMKGVIAISSFQGLDVRRVDYRAFGHLSVTQVQIIGEICIRHAGRAGAARPLLPFQTLALQFPVRALSPRQASGAGRSRRASQSAKQALLSRACQDSDGLASHGGPSGYWRSVLPRRCSC